MWVVGTRHFATSDEKQKSRKKGKGGGGRATRGKRERGGGGRGYAVSTLCLLKRIQQSVVGSPSSDPHWKGRETPSHFAGQTQNLNREPLHAMVPTAGGQGGQTPSTATGCGP